MSTEKRIVLHGRKVIGGKAEGEALVSKLPLMGFTNIDVKDGWTIERGHPLYEVPFQGKVLVFTEPRGSGGFSRYGATRHIGKNPAAFVYRKGNNLTVFAALEMQVPSMTDFDQDPVAVIETGDHVIVDADKGVLEVIKRK